ncbi:MAG: hypothetical protein IT370_31845 [Deltaproteobacteria bacterium]|nr:hypothetical protein [Deltaproteobacteria bacterium]
MRLNGDARVGVRAAGALSRFGLAWRGLGAALAAGEVSPGSGEVALAAADDAGDVKQRRLMSRAARLGAVAARLALREAELPVGTAREDVGTFMGVGASGGEPAQIEALVAASYQDGGFSLARCGHEGLAAATPLLAFQLMNNFTLCHGAILEGVGGVNAALFSRGAGTVLALAEAMAALAHGDCALALAGGADSALHPATRAELEREGHVAGGLMCAEGAGLLLLGPATGARVVIDGCWLWPAAARARGERDAARALDGLGDLALAAERDVGDGFDVVVVTGWGHAAADRLLAVATRLGRRVIDAGAGLGETLAAAPALAWLVALDVLGTTAGDGARALVLSAGCDGALGAVTLQSMAGVAGFMKGA